MTTATVENTMVCAGCQSVPSKIRLKSDGKQATPFRWKRVDGELLCPDCQPEVKCINWSYDCKGPTENADIVFQQMKLAHKYRNKLVEIERKRRDLINATIKKISPDLVEIEDKINRLDAQILELTTAIKAVNQTKRKRAATPEQQVQMKALKAQRKEARQQIKARRTEVFGAASTKAALAVIDDEHQAIVKKARRDSGLYWGNSGAVDKAMRSIRTGQPPRFLGWRGDGRIAMQIQKGMSVAKALSGTDTRLQILFPTDQSQFKKKLVNSNGKLAQARIRVGSTKDGKPLWTSVYFRMSRDIPETATIKMVYLLRRRIATHDRWKIVMSIEYDNAKADRALTGRVGIDAGWRLLPDGSLRVAYWIGSDGKQGQLVLPSRLVSSFSVPDKLRSIRDILFNTAVDKLSAWMKANKPPEWMIELTKTMGHWRSAYKMVKLVNHWRENRFEGDEEIYRELEGWPENDMNGRRHYHGFRKQDKHLYDWQEFQRRKSQVIREQLYRNFAAKMRRMYATACVECINWRDEIQKLPPAESNENQTAARMYFRVSAVGSLLAILKENMRFTVKCDPHLTTKTCSRCGTVNQFDSMLNLIHTCQNPHCGQTWDQDENAAANLLKMGEFPENNGTADEQ